MAYRRAPAMPFRRAGGSLGPSPSRGGGTAAERVLNSKPTNIYMEIRNVHVAFFSATYTTRAIARQVSARLGGSVVEHDITNGSAGCGPLTVGGGDVLVAAVPVYAGRVPALARERFSVVRGDGVPAVAVCVYGNRDYDDALLELCDILGDGGFSVVAAGVFIGRHSIFPDMGAGRPDGDDMNRAVAFGDGCARLIASARGFGGVLPPAVKGHRPYKEPGGLPLHPAASVDECSRCGVCAGQCPAGAIPADRPYLTDGAACISCGRCIVACPSHARRYSGALYDEVKAKFTAMFSARREPETFFPEGFELRGKN